MQTITRRLTLFSLAVALIVAVPSVVSLHGQRGAAPPAGQQKPAQQAARKKALFLTYPGIAAHASLQAAEEQTVEFGKIGGFDVTVLQGYTKKVGKQDLAFFTPQYLNQFDVLMTMSNGDIGLSTDQKKMIVDFVRNGKAFVGVHCGGVLLMYDYPEFGELIGGYYYQSILTPVLGPQFPPGLIPPSQKGFGLLKVEDNTHPATRMFTTSWPLSEEFYTFATAPWNESEPDLNISSPGNFKAPMGFSRDRVHVLLSLDTEHTNLDGASPRAKIRKGADRPQSWWRNFGKGRVFYTALGHSVETWTNDAAFRAHFTGGTRWALGLEN